MKLGIAMFTTDYSVDPVTLARLVEERGFESLFFPEHTHIPVSRKTPYPAGGELPREYSHIYDPFVALAAAATATERIKLATGICLVIERDPIVTAKEVASLDMVSGGRFLFGVGAGWNLEEMENHGTNPKRRFSIMRERIEAMKAIWTQDEAEYHGEHVDFDPIWSWPKPVQKPHPPILVGGNGEKVLERVVAYGDEWMPNPQRGVRERIAELQRLAEEAGRGPIPVTLERRQAGPRGDRARRGGGHPPLPVLRPAGGAGRGRALPGRAGEAPLTLPPPLPHGRAPAPSPAAASPAAIRPGRARRRPNSDSTSGHTLPSISSPAPSGVEGSSLTGIGAENATCTRLGLGTGPANSLSVPVIAHGTIGAPVSSASRPAPRLGAPSPSGSRTRVPSGNSASSPPWRRITRAVSRASWSAWPRRTGKAPRRMRMRPRLPSNSSLLPMKRRWRRVHTAMKNESQKLLWFGATIAAPSPGMCSAPSMCIRK